jgi:hypothetical protein
MENCSPASDASRPSRVFLFKMYMREVDRQTDRQTEAE